MELGIEDLIPSLQGKAYRVTSPIDDKYNCIAWAAGDTKNWWWPDSEDDFWPIGVPQEETLAAFEQAFGTLGYVVADSLDFEPDVEKVALFTDSKGFPKHAARQVRNGRWSSKLGIIEDIEHDLHDLEGAAYGSVARHETGNSGLKLADDRLKWCFV